MGRGPPPRRPGRLPSLGTRSICSLGGLTVSAFAVIVALIALNAEAGSSR